jgi:GNAT superfamily N-acetyltransferase
VSLPRQLLEHAALAFPPACDQRLDGWWLRHTSASAWWASSVLPHGDAAPTDLPDRIRLVEEFYAEHGAPPRFQVSPAACPADLDEALAERGYRADSPMSLRTAPTARVREQLPAGGPGVRLDERPTDAWWDAWHAVHGTGAGPETDRALLGRIDRPCVYATVTIGSEVASVGRALADAGRAGVFAMATLPHARSRGAASRVLGALAGWAAQRDATLLYLQVTRDNEAALRLYERAGFTEVCVYHYRTASHVHPPSISSSSTRKQR